MSFGITELLVILAIVVLLFGTTKLRSLGGDLGSAIKGFRNAIGNDDEKLEADVKDATPTTDSMENSSKVEASKDD